VSLFPTLPNNRRQIFIVLRKGTQEEQQLTTRVTGESFSSSFPLDVKSDRAYDHSVRNGRKTTDEEKTSQVVGDEVDGDVVVVPSAAVVDVTGFEELDAVEVFAFADSAKEC